VLGIDRFDPAFRAYLRAWAFRHPTPADFIRLMRDQSGVDLDWFFREWIYTTARLDQAVDSVTTQANGQVLIHLSNRGSMVMPLTMDIYCASEQNGQEVVRVVHLPVDMWNLGPQFTYRLTPDLPVKRVQVDPRAVLPDVDRRNNEWPR
jgi:hypothetical protein